MCAGERGTGRALRGKGGRGGAAKVSRRAPAAHCWSIYHNRRYYITYIPIKTGIAHSFVPLLVEFLGNHCRVHTSVVHSELSN